MSLRRRVQMGAGLSAGLLGVLSLGLPSPYLIESPGPIFNTTGEVDDEPVISLDEDTDVHETDGSLALTTVLVSGEPTTRVTVPQAVAGWISGSDDVMPHELVYPSGTTAEEVHEANTAAMASSQELALAAALDYQEVDYDVELSVMDFTPEATEVGIDELLSPGDQVLAADGEEITGLEGLRSAVNEAAGQPVELTVIRDGDHVDVEAPTYLDADGEYYVGIMLGSDFEFPVSADIQLEDVGGPSAGLMFSLGIIDRMDEESLTGGEEWAGTGTVDPDGTIGPIGGIAQKVVGAVDDEADHFLAPRENCDELTGRIPDELDVYGVEDVEQAADIVQAVRDNDEDFLAGLEPCGD